MLDFTTKTTHYYKLQFHHTNSARKYLLHSLISVEKNSHRINTDTPCIGFWQENKNCAILFNQTDIAQNIVKNRKPLDSLPPQIKNEVLNGGPGTRDILPKGSQGPGTITLETRTICSISIGPGTKAASSQGCDQGPHN